jgi:hypothetical protein
MKSFLNLLITDALQGFSLGFGIEKDEPIEGEI